MKIKSISIQGFRGFNEKRTIDLNDRLTLIYAPNSYGKTSISEALEWLLYSITSKLEKADSIEEYKGSYRNKHLPESLQPFVKVTFIVGSTETEYYGELLEDDRIKKFLNGNEVDAWPLFEKSFNIPKPFILQHALKYLLLVKPLDRFQGFAKLLGLEELDKIQQDVVALCTKPQARIPAEVTLLLQNIENFEGRLKSLDSLNKIWKSYKRSSKGDLNKAYQAIIEECKSRVEPDTDEQSLIPRLLKLREDAVSTIYEGKIVLYDFSETEKLLNSEDQKYFLNCITETFIKKYTDLISLSALQYVLKKADFYDLGIQFLEENKESCPFCGQSIDKDLYKHIHKEHKSFEKERDRNQLLQNQLREVKEALLELKKKLNEYQTRHVEKSTGVLKIESTLEELKKILIPKHQIHYDNVKIAISELKSSKENLEKLFKSVLQNFEEVEKSIEEFRENTSLIKKLSDSLVDFISHTHLFTQLISKHISPLSEADQILRHELDLLAGTEDITILIELLEQRNNIEKKFEIENIISGLKEFRKTVDQFVAKKMLSVISDELTGEVMKWYNQVKTTGDPDVHFDGFDMPRNQKGELIARRVQIKAKSYGEELVSAVSSLSESKLNALGLCVSIATNLKSQSPFQFLLIDDPIQSLDADHEIQFIEVIRKLVESGKQIILLSHNKKWLEQTRSHCRSLNGYFYEITGYNELGPHILQVPWEKWGERLKEVDAIIKNPKSNSTQLQQAEEEIRIIVADLTSELYFKQKQIKKSAHNLNSTKVRKMLIECGVDLKIVDKIVQTFETTDDAHHAATGYSANRERIKRYQGWANELARIVDKI